jgi:steroid delta-isomerase-like uncharacterized protein
MSTAVRGKTDPDAARRAALTYLEGEAAREVERIVSACAPGYVEDNVVLGRLEGTQKTAAFFNELFTAIPDFELWIDRVIAGGDEVAVEWHADGTFNGGPFQGIRPTGGRIELKGVDVFEVSHGRIARNTVYYDGASFARQIGMLPAPGSLADRAMLRMFNLRTRLKRAIRRR